MPDYLWTQNDSSKHYNFKEFYIKVDFNLSSILNDPPDQKNFSFFIHEYSHYLQTISTVFGANIVYEYCKIIEQILDYVENKNYKIKISNLKKFDKSISKISQIYYYDRTNSILEYYKNKHINFNDLDFITHDYKHPFFKEINKECYIFFENELINISPLVLRESMAMAAMFIYFQYDNKKIFEYFNQNLSSNKSNKPYKVLFYYFNSKIDNNMELAEFVFYFSELALQHKNPTHFLYNLFEQVTSSQFNKNTWLLFNNIKKVSQIYNGSSIAKIRDSIKEKRENYYEKEKTNSFYNELSEILDRCIMGLNYHLKKSSLFNDLKGINKKTLSKWVTFLLSPLIIQETKEDFSDSEIKTSILVSNQNNVISEEDNKLISVFCFTELLHTYNSSTYLSECPFLKIQICKDYMNVSDRRTCKISFLNTKFKDCSKKCLCMKINSILGIQDQINFVD